MCKGFHTPSNPKTFRKNYVVIILYISEKAKLPGMRRHLLFSLLILSTQGWVAAKFHASKTEDQDRWNKHRLWCGSLLGIKHCSCNSIFRDQICRRTLRNAYSGQSLQLEFFTEITYIVKYLSMFVFRVYLHQTRTYLIICYVMHKLPIYTDQP